MGDFKNVMKNWRRMCKKHGIISCNECPLIDNQTCGYFETATDNDIENAEKIITEWAEKNPEKVYPTWLDFLKEQNFIISIEREICFGQVDIFYLAVTPNIVEPIPADIAERLGLEPK